MTILFIDPSGGASGDKLVAALVDLGFDPENLRVAFRPLIDLFGLTIKAVEDIRGGLRGIRLAIEAPSQPPGRSFTELDSIMSSLSVPKPVIDRSRAALRRLAETEGRIHRISPEKVHFHEIGGLDTIVDIVGFFLIVNQLAPNRVICGPVPVGTGTVSTAHGDLPLPAPATLELLAGVPIFSPGIEGELTTPTGAVLLAEGVDHFGPLPAMTAEAIGYGLGNQDLKSIPNVLRIIRGRTEKGETDTDTVVIFETVIDDMTGEMFGSVIDHLLEAGAVEAYLQPVLMKKGRPGQVLTVLAPLSEQKKVLAALFKETTTFGVRYRVSQRRILHRTIETIATEWGPVRVKIGTRGGKIMTISPEFVDCQAISETSGLPIREIYRRISSLAESLRTTYPAETTSPPGGEIFEDQGR